MLQDTTSQANAAGALADALDLSNMRDSMTSAAFWGTPVRDIGAILTNIVNQNAATQRSALMQNAYRSNARENARNAWIMMQYKQAQENIRDAIKNQRMYDFYDKLAEVKYGRNVQMAEQGGRYWKNAGKPAAAAGSSAAPAMTLPTPPQADPRDVATANMAYFDDPDVQDALSWQPLPYAQQSMQGYKGGLSESLKAMRRPPTAAPQPQPQPSPNPGIIDIIRALSGLGGW